MLVAELDHRVKNVLATVSAVASRTQDASLSAADFGARLASRIQSMAATHELLSCRQWKGISMRELVQRELAPYMGKDNTILDGPDLTLSPEAGQTMSMVLHELTTNAAKHGALSTDDGLVSVRWRQLQNGHAHACLCIEWQETGGPPVEAGQRSSYGTEVIRNLIPYQLDGTVDLTFARQGVRCVINIPATEPIDRDRGSVRPVDSGRHERELSHA
jgi:two-component sensor histidine kinase